MSKASASPISIPISILVVEDDPGDFGLIRAHVRMSGLVMGGNTLVPGGNTEPVIWAKTLADGITAGRAHGQYASRAGNPSWRSPRP